MPSSFKSDSTKDLYRPKRLPKKRTSIPPLGMRTFISRKTLPLTTKWTSSKWLLGNRVRKTCLNRSRKSTCQKKDPKKAMDLISKLL